MSLDVLGGGAAAKQPKPAEDRDRDQIHQSEQRGSRSCHAHVQSVKPQVIACTSSSGTVQAVPRLPSYAGWCCDWPRRIPHGGIGGSRGNSPGSVTRLRPARSGRSSSDPALTRHLAMTDPPGQLHRAVGPRGGGPLRSCPEGVHQKILAGRLHVLPSNPDLEAGNR